METRSYILDNLIPTFNEFIVETKNFEFGRNRSINLATGLASKIKNLSEFLYDEKEQKINKTYSLIRPKKSENLNIWRSNLQDPFYFKLCCDLSDASKHKKLNRKDRLIDSIHAIEEKLTIVRFQDKEGYYYRLVKLITIKLNDKNVYLAENVLRKGAVSILTECIKFGIIDKLPNVEPPMKYPLPRETGDAIFDYNQVELERLSIPLYSLVHDYQKQQLFEVSPQDEFNFEFQGKILIQRSPFK